LTSCFSYNNLDRQGQKIEDQVRVTKFWTGIGRHQLVYQTKVNNRSRSCKVSRVALERKS